MNEILDFLIRHWLLSASFIVLFVAYLVFEFKYGLTEKKSISPERAVELYNRQQAVILDLRSTSDFNQGHIVGSAAIEISAVDTEFKVLQKYAQKTIVLVSGDGKRAVELTHKMAQQGFANVFSLAGGINAWIAAGLPLVKR